MREMDAARSWWRRLLAPAAPDIAERLTGHSAAELRLAHGLARDAGSVTRYPHAKVRILDAAARAQGRARRIRRALEESGHPVTEPVTKSGPLSGTAWERLRAAVSELGRVSEAYLADAHAVEREHTGFADLLHELHRQAAEDRGDLIWTLAQLAGIAVDARSLEEIAA